MSNDLVVQLGAKLDQFQSDMNQAGDIADDARVGFRRGRVSSLVALRLLADWTKFWSCLVNRGKQRSTPHGECSGGRLLARGNGLRGLYRFCVSWGK